MGTMRIVRMIGSLGIALTLLAGCAPGGAGQNCGVWRATIAAQDTRVIVEPAPASVSDGCVAAITLKGNTKALGIIGGYTMEMTTERASHLRSREWASIPANHPEQLIPGRFSTLRLAPEGGDAEIVLLGAVTPDSLKTDAALFLIKSALASVNLPGSCVIPAEVILGAATSAGATFTPVGDALAARDITEATAKLRAVSDPYLKQAAEYLKGQAPQCAVGALATFLATVTGAAGIVFVAKTAVNFASWAGAVIEDRATYGGQPVRVTLTYTRAP